MALFNVVRRNLELYRRPAGIISQPGLAGPRCGSESGLLSAPNCWTPPEKPMDWAPLDNLCRQIIAVNPKVLLVPRVGADAPDWWLDSHPGARMVYDGDKVVNHSCVSDRAYRAAVCRTPGEDLPPPFARPFRTTLPASIPAGRIRANGST